MSDDRRQLERLLPDYEVRDRIGQGEFGAVWEGRHRHLDRRVAIKQLLRAADGTDGARFNREARILAALDHGNVVAVYDYREREDEGVRALVMEHLDGGTFAQRRGGCALDDVLAAIRAAATGIGHAHRRGVLHRDVKPSNLMFDARGRVKVTDFGLASRSGATPLDATIAGSFIGTPAYISPEQARRSLGDDRVSLTAASDQYSLAAVLYETLTGALTHDAAHGVLALCEHRINAPARDIAQRRGDLPGPLRDAIMRALEREPGARHESIEAFGLALAATGDGPTLRSRVGRGDVVELIGRDAELDELRRLVRECGLVTITAMGGVGKTALARALQGAPPDGFVDGAHFVDLNGVTDEQQVRHEVRQALGLRDLASADATDELAELLGDRALLLVLDNCEQVREPVAELAAAVLRRSTTVAIVATSRVPLAIAGEQVIRLAPLAAPPASGGLDDLAASPAARLFVERARRQRPDFTIDAANAPAVREIARRLDGIPLALELAAARVRAMSAAEIAAHLDSRFRLLTARTDDPRRRTLLDTIGWSYAQLGDAERRALEVCGVFVGGFDLEAAQAVLGATIGADAFEVIDVIDQLVDRSLLQRNEEASGQSRYVVLESVKEFTRDHAEGGETALDGARVAHLEHFGRVAERDGPALCGPAQVAINHRLRLDQENFLLALDTAAERAGRADDGLRGAFALRYFLVRNSIAPLVRERVERLCEKTDDHELEALGLTLLVTAYCAHGRVEDAMDAAARAMRLVDGSVDTSRVAGRVLQSRALARLYAGDNDGGLDDARRLLSSPAISHDRLALAEARNLVAIARRMMDDVEDARVEYAVVAAIYRDVGDVFGAAIGLVNLADCAIALDDLDSAERDLEAARPLVDECDSPQLIAYFHGNLGLVAQRRNDLEQARREFASAIATSEQIGDRQTVLNNLISFAAVLVDSDEPRAAYLAAAADALATRSALTPDPNEQKLWESTRDRLADRVDADLERARAEGRDASLRAVVDLVQSLVS